jgi:hypothetical protein
LSIKILHIKKPIGLRYLWQKIKREAHNSERSEILFSAMQKALYSKHNNIAGIGMANINLK